MLVIGVSGLVVFYLSVMAIGIWAGSKRGAAVSGADLEGALLAGRALPFPVGVVTLVATWVGAAFIGGIPEAVYERGIIWCQIPIGYCLSFLIGGLWFAMPMRRSDHETLVDPIQERYGPRVGAVISAPAIFGDILRSAAVLSCLGSAMGVVLGMSLTFSVVGTAVFVTIYTMLGGLYSVAYTDVAQVTCVILGLVLSAPFAASNPSATLLGGVDWLGTLSAEGFGEWFDVLLLLALGGIPWQSYFQRVLATKSPETARLMSLSASGCCLLMAIPSMVIGVIAKGTDWSSVSGFHKNITEADEARSVLPMVMRFMTPEWVSFIGLGAVSAAVMSSADSSFLSTSSLLSKNIYRVILRPEAPDYEVLWVLRCGVVATAAVAATMALTMDNIICISFLCSDLVYVILFPQLLLSLHWKSGANSYGAIVSFFVGSTMRLMAGDVGLGIPAMLKYPLYNAETGHQGAPHRTIAMLSTLAVHVLTSYGAKVLLDAHSGSFGPKYDFLKCFIEQPSKETLPFPHATDLSSHSTPLYSKDGAASPTPPSSPSILCTPSPHTSGSKSVSIAPTPSDTLSLKSPPSSPTQAPLVMELNGGWSQPDGMSVSPITHQPRSYDIPMVNVRVRFSDDPEKDLEESGNEWEDFAKR